MATILTTHVSQKLKPIIVFILGLFIIPHVFAQSLTPEVAWARQINGTLTSTLVLDDAGNSYTIGNFPANSTVNIGGVIINGQGSNENSFIAKFDPDGNTIWAKHITRIGGFYGTGYDYVPADNKLAVDADGNVYIAGSYLSGALIDTQTLLGNYGQFIACFNSQGDLQWTHIIKCQDNVGAALYLYWNNDEIKVVGLFNTKVLLTDHDSITNPNSTPGVDAYVASFDSDGAFIEVLELGVINSSFTPSAPLSDEIFNFDENGSIYRFVPNGKKLYKYGPAGNILFTKAITASGATTELTSMSVDRDGNMFLAGFFLNGSLTFEGTLIPKYGNAMYTDAILAKFTPTGNMEWIRKYTYLYTDAYIKTRVDDIGNIYALGQHATLGGDTRAVLTKYNPAGDSIWQHIITPGPPVNLNDPPGVVTAENLVLAQNGGNIIVVGYYKERIQFDDQISFFSPGAYKIFLAQYGICDAPVPSITSSATSFCEGDSIMLTVSGQPNYLWSTGDTTITIFVAQTGSYHVLSVENEQCYGKSSEINITAHPLPNDSVSINGITLTAYEANADYVWINCATQAPVTGANGQSFTPTQNGEYAVEITNSVGCTNLSSCYTIANVSIHEAMPQSNITMYPNPAIDMLYLSGDENIKSVIITNTLGQQIIKEKYTAGINISTLSSGTYFISVQTKVGVWKSKFVKQ